MKKIIGVSLLVMLLLFASCGSSPKPSPSSLSAPDLTGVTSYYVRDDGNDSNAGTSEGTPFKTLAKALEAAAKTPVKQITVISALTYSRNSTVINSGSEDILIRGKSGAAENEKAVLKGFGTL